MKSRNVYCRKTVAIAFCDSCFLHCLMSIIKKKEKKGEVWVMWAYKREMYLVWGASRGRWMLSRALERTDELGTQEGLAGLGEWWLTQVHALLRSLKLFIGTCVIFLNAWQCCSRGDAWNQNGSVVFGQEVEMFKMLRRTEEESERTSGNSWSTREDTVEQISYFFHRSNSSNVTCSMLDVVIHPPR